MNRLLIGYINDIPVYFYNGVIYVKGTQIIATGAKTKEEAVDIAKRNFANFREK